jgi:hypothetical protein
MDDYDEEIEECLKEQAVHDHLEAAAKLAIRGGWTEALFCDAAAHHWTNTWIDDIPASAWDSLFPEGDKS